MAQLLLRKRLVREINEDVETYPVLGQQIVQMIGTRGNYLYEVESAQSDEKFLVSMPRKFRNVMWVMRGKFLIIEPIPEGKKVKGEIVRIITEDDIEEYEKAGIWPEKFARKPKPVKEIVIHDDEDSSEFIVHNLNRPPCYDSESTCESDEESDEDSDDEDDDENGESSPEQTVKE